MTRVLLNALQAGNRSGTGRYTLELARALREQTELDLSTLWPQALGTPDYNAGRLIIRPGETLSRLLDDQWRIDGFARLAGASFAHYPANVGLLRGSLPFVLTLHDLSFLHHPEWYTRSRALYYRFAVSRSARRARRIITGSAYTKADIMERLGVPEDHIDVTPYGVRAVFRPADYAAQGEAIEALGIPDQYFVYVGTLEPRKNLARLIQAWDHTASEHSFDLVIVGREGWKLDGFQSALLGARHRERIHCVGHLPETQLIAVISAARAFLWPSLFEGFGLPPLEAMACGAPVLTSNTSSLPEVCGDAAILVDPLDIDAIADGIRRLASDNRLREDYRLRGRSRAKQFTWERTAQLTMESYRRALA